MSESEKSLYRDKFFTEFNLDDNKYMPHTVVFPPIGLNWPDYCIGCNKPNPSLTLRLSVNEATKASTGENIGVVFGVFALMAGSIIAGDAKETPWHEIPICESCQQCLSKKKIKEIKGSLEGPLQSARPIVTPFFIKDIIRKRVIFTFKNHNYAVKFAKSNKNSFYCSFNSCEDDDNILDNMVTNYIDVVPSDTFIQSIFRMFKPFAMKKWIFVAPDIPHAIYVLGPTVFPVWPT